MAFAIIAVLILILDQGVKYWVNSALDWYQGMDFIPGFISIYKVQNTGGAFGFMKDTSWFPTFIVVLSILISCLIAFFIARKVIKGALGSVSAVFVMAGALGNCIDRLLTGVTSGYVTDMFRFELSFLSSFPIFNVADIFLVAGGILFAVYFMMDTDEPAKKRAPVGANAAGADLVQLPSDRGATPRTRQPSTQRQTTRQSPAEPRQRQQTEPRQSQEEPRRQAPRQSQAEPRQQTPRRPQEPTPAEPRQPQAEPRPRRVPQTESPTPTTTRPTSQPQAGRATPPRRSIEIEPPEYSLDDILAEFSDDDA